MDSVNDVRLISVGLHRLLSDLVGSEKIIATRRVITDLGNDLEEFITGADDNLSCYLFLSGSKAEGFRFKSSDDDYMVTDNDIRVIQSMSQCRLYDVNTTLLMMETEESKPGFALLRLINETDNPDITRSCVPHSSGLYVSSQKWRDEDPEIKHFEIIHGPCLQYKFGTQEYDLAVCLKADIFPKVAIGCIKRLYERGWPSTQSIESIVTGGCHFVAIPAKVSNFEHLEWRISFSCAEKILVHEMNYTQFLCYGLLKIFLKEAINANAEIEGLLCSYYLKTAVFWEIMDLSQIWNPSTFLLCFWGCFTRLISWVYEEYCPNFFIPENNMMIGKFNEATKRKLLDHLIKLFNEGYECLLRCPSVCDDLSKIMQTPMAVSNLPLEEERSNKVVTDIQIIKEFSRISVFNEIQSMIKGLDGLDHLMKRYNTNLQRLTLQVWKSEALCRLYLHFVGQETENKGISNKELYPSVSKFLLLMHQCRVDPVYNYLLMAIGMYKQRQFENVLKIVNKIKSKLLNPLIIDESTLDTDKYRAAGGEIMPLITMMKHFVTSPVILSAEICLPELKPEHQVGEQDLEDDIAFPSLLITQFLTFLSYWNMGYRHDAKQTVKDMLEVRKNNFYNDENNLSLVVMGICLEMMGEYELAFLYLSTVLWQQGNVFQNATIMRLLIILYKLYIMLNIAEKK